MPRVFIAVNLPTEIKNELAVVEKEIKSLFPEEIQAGVAKWIKTDNLHITLLFIGQLKDEAVPQISQIVKETLQGWQPFAVEFKKICYGPNKKMPPRLIWVELEKNKDLECVANILKQKMEALLQRSDNRPFSAHITLARIRAWQWKSIPPEERPAIEREIDFVFDVSSVDIMESKLNPKGPQYTILKSINFAKL